MILNQDLELCHFHFKTITGDIINQEEKHVLLTEFLQILFGRLLGK